MGEIGGPKLIEYEPERTLVVHQRQMDQVTKYTLLVLKEGHRPDQKYRPANLMRCFKNALH
jgi:hypothetical protein